MRVREDGKREEERLPRAVDHDHRERPDAQERIAEQEADAGEHAVALLRRRGHSASRHERPDEQERDGERRRVDEEQRRRADDADQHARGGRPEQHRHARGALEERVRPRHERLVLAEQLWENNSLRTEVRREEGPRDEDDREQEPEREQAAPVQRRHERE